MSCSKIFSGTLPELTENIIKYFQDDYSTLYSCVLVNRFWCRLSIPLLWKNPFSISTGNYNFIRIYLHNLNVELKTKLNEYKINENLLLSNTLFNYPSFLKYLNLSKIVTSVEKWFYTTRIKNLDIKKLIIMSLLKIFIKNEVNLHTLEIEINLYIEYFDDILELILQNLNFILNAKILKLFILKSKLFNNNSNSTLINNRVLQVINLHQNLKNIILTYNNDKEFLFYQSLLLSKDYNCSNTLNTITLYRINFKDMINLNKMFEQLNVLESVHIIFCYSLNTSFIQQILNLTKPFKLRSLFLNGRSGIKKSSLLLLLQKSGCYLKNFRYSTMYNESDRVRQMFGSVINYCKNIKYLDIDDIIYPVVLDLIENIKQNLNYLFISSEIIRFRGSPIILRNLGQILPSRLEYLDLTLCIDVSDFEVFLKNSQGIFIKKLLIKDLDENNYDNILPYIKKYIMKEKRVGYLNFRNHNKELFDFSDEVKEFKLYNIRVRKYEDLYFNIYQFMQKLY
ncbi:hypothetical protein RhiirB3_449193 [Rhizophagus irregularis]|nr:hypothetical protein RhiirB3_449193 [Rhizophagus irregularis]